MNPNLHHIIIVDQQYRLPRERRRDALVRLGLTVGLFLAALGLAGMVLFAN